MRWLLALVSVTAAVLAGVAAVPTAATAQTEQTAHGGYVPVPITRIWNGTGVGGHTTKAVTVTGRDHIPTSGVGAVAMTISVTSAGTSGSVVAYASGAVRPGTVNVQFGPGRRTSDLAVVVPGSNGKVALHNNSGRSISVTIDLSGYYTSGATGAIKSYHPVKATRLVDSLTIGAGRHANPVLGGKGPVPGSQVGAVAMTITERSASRYGALGAKAYDLPIKGEKVLHWTGGQRVSSFAIVPVDANGQLTLTNYSAAGVDVAVDVVGYFLQGAPWRAGMLDGVPSGNALSGQEIGAGETFYRRISGGVGVPLYNPQTRAVVLTVTVTSSPSASGSVLVYPDRTTRPSAASVQFGGNETASNTVIVPLGGEIISIYNHSAGSVRVSVDVTGWVLDQDLDVPATRTGHYLRSLIRGHARANNAAMRRLGAGDAASDFVLLQLGAQRNDKSGVQESATSDEAHHIDYPGLVAALQAYIDGYNSNGAGGGAGAIAIGTNNDANDWTHYTGTQRGKDWATRVINRLHGGGTAIAGASDIEPGFGTHQVSDAMDWKSAFLANSSAQPPVTQFMFTGSADGCPVDFNRPHATCAYGWTEGQLKNLAGGSRTVALPQIFNSRMAIQWANIEATGESMLQYVGALTEYALGDSYPPQQGYAALYNARSAVDYGPGARGVVDLDVA